MGQENVTFGENTKTLWPIPPRVYQQAIKNLICYVSSKTKIHKASEKYGVNRSAFVALNPLCFY